MVYENIKKLRLANEKSQKQIAIKINISQRSYSHYENGDRDIPCYVLIELAKYYNVSVDYLLGLTKNQKRN